MWFLDQRTQRSIRPWCPLGWLVLSAGLMLVVASPASATIGLAEWSVDLRYNQFALLQVHHSDCCSGPDKECMSLVPRQGHANQGFYDLEFSLEQVNLPADHANPLIIAQRSQTQHWLVHNLQTGSRLIETPSYQAALQVWTAQGLPAPTFVDPFTARDHLWQTWSSMGVDLMFGLMMLNPTSLAILVVVLLAVAFVLKIVISAIIYLIFPPRKATTRQ